MSNLLILGMFQIALSVVCLYIGKRAVAEKQYDLAFLNFGLFLINLLMGLFNAGLVMFR